MKYGIFVWYILILFALVIFWAHRHEFFSREEVILYQYYKGEDVLRCVYGEAVTVGPIRSPYNYEGERVTCEILNHKTGKTKFSIPVQHVVLIRASELEGL